LILDRFFAIRFFHLWLITIGYGFGPHDGNILMSFPFTFQAKRESSLDRGESAIGKTALSRAPNMLTKHSCEEDQCVPNTPPNVKIYDRPEPKGPNPVFVAIAVRVFWLFASYSIVPSFIRLRQRQRSAFKYIQLHGLSAADARMWQLIVFDALRGAGEVG